MTAVDKEAGQLPTASDSSRESENKSENKSENTETVETVVAVETLETAEILEAMEKTSAAVSKSVQAVPEKSASHFKQSKVALSVLRDKMSFTLIAARMERLSKLNDSVRADHKKQLSRFGQHLTSKHQPGRVTIGPSSYRKPPPEEVEKWAKTRSLDVGETNASAKKRSTAAAARFSRLSRVSQRKNTAEEPVLTDEQKFKIDFGTAVAIGSSLLAAATDEALEHLARHIFAVPPSVVYNKPKCSEDFYSGYTTAEHKKGGFMWPANAKFTSRKGYRWLEAFIESWERHAMWRFYIKLLEKKDELLQKIYRYEITWMCSTRRKPVPKVTAKVYFLIFKSKVPTIKKQSVKVAYYYEGQQTLHSDTAACNLSAVTLLRIMDNKIYETRNILKALKSLECI